MAEQTHAADSYKSSSLFILTVISHYISNNNNQANNNEDDESKLVQMFKTLQLWYNDLFSFCHTEGLYEHTPQSSCSLGCHMMLALLSSLIKTLGPNLHERSVKNQDGFK